MGGGLVKQSRIGRALDYLPLAAYLIFWVLGGYVASLMTKDAGLMRLPFVTLPGIILMIIALARVGERHKRATACQADSDASESGTS
jgi:hypothetical protein